MKPRPDPGPSPVLGCAVLANMGLTMAVVFMAKDQAVGATGISVAKNGNVVQTGTLEEVFQTTATSDAFAKIVEETDVLRTRPSAMIVDFADGSMVQFPPLQIQIFATSALVANLQIGVKVQLKKGETPVFSFTGVSMTLSMISVPGLLIVAISWPYSCCTLSTSMPPHVSRLSPPYPCLAPPSVHRFAGAATRDDSPYRRRCCDGRSYRHTGARPHQGHQDRPKARGHGE